MRFAGQTRPDASFSRLYPQLLLAFAIPIVLLGSTTVIAQARPAATRNSEISAFAEYETLWPNNGTPSERGFLGGIDYLRFRGPILISFEARGSVAPRAAFEGTKTLLIGGRFDLRSSPKARFQPYVNLLAGLGSVSFTHPSGSYYSDNSLVYNYGLGADYALAHHIWAQAEFQEQHWNLGNRGNPQPFLPALINFGVRYRIPFRNNRTIKH